jgi:alkanesulfonate monooxygenase
MPVEFIGMIGTRDESETRLTPGPIIDRGYVRRFTRAHEDAGFDRVLIGYSSSRPDGTQVAAPAGGSPCTSSPAAATRSSVATATT